MDNKLLLDIFHIPALSNKEDEISRYIVDWLTFNDIPFSIDNESKTIYNISNMDRPLVAAHLDTVQDVTDAMLAKYIKISGNILSGYGVIGGDDKCGIYIILTLLKKYKDLNFCFFPAEEVGCQGSKKFVKNVTGLEKIPYGLVFDRKNNCDIICYKNSYGNYKFDDALSAIGKDLGYSSAYGATSDANTLREFMSCANLSVGYYLPHSKKEYVNLDDLENAYLFAEKIIEKVDEKFEKPYITYTKPYEYGEYEYDNQGRYIGKKKKNKKGSNWVKCDCCNLYSGGTRTYLKTIKMNVCEKCLNDLFLEIGASEETKDIDDLLIPDDAPKAPLLPSANPNDYNDGEDDYNTYWKQRWY